MTVSGLHHRTTYSTDSAYYLDTQDSDVKSSKKTSRSSSSSRSVPSSSAKASHTRRNSKMSSILPRVGGYKRVDDTDGPSVSGRIRFGRKKFAIGAVVVIGLVWVFGPRERREQVIGSVTPISWGKPVHPPQSNEDIGYGDSMIPSSSTTSRPPSTIKAPHSPEDDPDLSKTVFCSTPHDPQARLVQYALMIDAGSTGSRIHIYKFNNCGPSPAYEYEVFEQTQPGLSAYPTDPEKAAVSLDVLLDTAVEVVPDALRKCTPVAVKATAGLRLLGTRESEGILEAVRRRLGEKYPFSVVEKDGVVIMDGKDEGVYAWITANYLLGAIGSGNTPGASSVPPPSYAVLDLGGASTQIVFEPNFDTEPDSAFVDGEHKYELQFGGKTYVLYQHSYLGYGLMRARQSVHRLVEFMATFSQAGPPPAPAAPVASFMTEIGNPCMSTGTRRTVRLDAVLPGELSRDVAMTGSDVGSFDGCNRIVELVMAKDAICQVKPCSFNGVYQPSILDTFTSGKVLLLSYFYDRIAPFFPPSDRPPLSISSIASLARDVCQGPKTWSARWGSNKALLAELEDRPEWCLDLTFMHALLRLGYEFEGERAVRIEKQVEGTELGWCLGATIAIVGGELTCRL